MMEKNVTVIKISPADNVGIVVNSSGLKKGIKLTDGTILAENIPMGHKVATSEIKEGAAILRYGVVIGHAKTRIARGEWVNETLISRSRIEEICRSRRPYS